MYIQNTLMRLIHLICWFHKKKNKQKGLVLIQVPNIMFIVNILHASSLSLSQKQTNKKKKGLMN